MRLTEIILRGIRRLPFLRIPAQFLLKKIIVTGKGRGFLNSFYRSMNYREREIFHTMYAKVFRDRDPADFSTTWEVDFASSKIKIPIVGHSVWLHWDVAISIVGHDIEVKRFYEKLIKSPYKPKCFFDIGANYGTHSILLLANGVQAITFEPNPHCAKYFDQLASENELQYNLENVAISDKPGNLNLVFPERDTWMGSIADSYQSNFQNFENVTSLEVPAITLDDYTDQHDLSPGLIKIDTEGFEVNVLRGGIKTIKQSKPLIIFESNHKAERPSLWEVINTLNFVIFDLNRLGHVLDDESFLSSPSYNFLAVSREHDILKEINHYS